MRPAWCTRSAVGACGEAYGGTPAREAKSSEGTGGVTLGELAIGFPNRPSRGLHSRSPLRRYPTASCGACPPTSTALHPYGRCHACRWPRRFSIGRATVCSGNTAGAPCCCACDSGPQAYLHPSLNSDKRIILPTLPHSGSRAIHELLADFLTAMFRRVLLEGQSGRLPCAQE